MTAPRETEALPAWESPAWAAVSADTVTDIFRLRNEGRQMETIPIIQEALKEDSPTRKDPNFWRALAFIHADSQGFEESKRAFWEIIKLIPNHPLAYLELCQACMACGDWDDAKMANDQALDLLAHEPIHHHEKIQATMNAATLAYRFGKPTPGRAYFASVADIPMEQMHDDVRFAVGMARLTLYHDRRAWALHERRLDTVALYKWSRDRGEEPGLPRWTVGKPGPVVFWQEQGAGDLIMALRYLPLIAESSGAPVIVRCDPPLWPIVRAMGPCVGALLGRTDVPPSHAVADLPILSAPYEFGMDGWDDIPPPVTPERYRWAPRRQPDVRIGIAWSGAKGHPGDKDRSAPVASLEEMARSFPSVTWQSLQPGECPDWMTRMVVANYGQTAELMQTLDAVITVDTSVVHLAATLGVPTWVVPPSGPEWRWGVSGPARWYGKNLRVVRRTDVRAWRGAWQRVAASVMAYLETE